MGVKYTHTSVLYSEASKQEKSKKKKKRKEKKELSTKLFNIDSVALEPDYKYF